MFFKNIFRKKKSGGLIQEVDDVRYIVNDFRRRIGKLFESYRALDYKMPPGYDIENLRAEDSEILAKLIASEAVDSGNEDCLLDRILGPVREGMQYLEDQRLRHMDFYHRYAAECRTNSEDINAMISFWEEKLAVIEKEHEETKKLLENYNSKRVRRSER